MKETFTIDEIKEFLDSALTKSMFDESKCESDAALMLDKAWNRGAKSVYNNALIEMYARYQEVSA